MSPQTSHHRSLALAAPLSLALLIGLAPQASARLAGEEKSDWSLDLTLGAIDGHFAGFSAADPLSVFTGVDFDPGYNLRAGLRRSILRGTSSTPGLGLDDLSLTIGAELQFSDRDTEDPDFVVANATPNVSAIQAISYSAILLDLEASIAISERGSFYAHGGFGTSLALNMDPLIDAISNPVGVGNTTPAVRQYGFGIRFALGEHSTWHLGYRVVETDRLDLIDSTTGVGVGSLENLQEVFEVGMRWSI